MSGRLLDAMCLVLERLIKEGKSLNDDVANLRWLGWLRSRARQVASGV